MNQSLLRFAATARFMAGRCWMRMHASVLRPSRLIHVEYYLADEDARRRESYFKTTKGKRALRLMLQETLALARKA